MPRISGAEQERNALKYTHYKQIDSAAEELDAQEKFDEELALLQSTEEQFPEYRFQNLWTQALVLRHIGQYKRCYKIIEALVRQGYFMPLDGKYWEPLRENAGFSFLQEESERLRAKAQSQACMKYVVYLPEGYSGEKRYPLFFVLHGDAGNIDHLSWYWQPGAVTRLGFVAAYVQSSQVRNSQNFVWLPNPQIARRDIKDCYDLVTSQFSIDLLTVIVGGFSGGAITALDLTLANIFPIKGFVCQSPELKPKGFSIRSVRRAAERGVKGVFMEGEKVIPVPDEQDMMQAFQEAGLPYQFYVNPGLEHAIPHDLAEKLHQAVEFITQ